MKPLQTILLLLMMAAGCGETTLLKGERLITKKEISAYPKWGKYRYEISEQLILYSDQELNVGDTLKLK